MNATLREVSTSDGIKEFLLVADIESPSLADDIEAFALELRRAAKVIKASSGNKIRSANRRKAGGPFGALGQYFDEFWGQRKKSKKNVPMVVDCYHGAIVRALRDAFVDGETFKSREIDLIVLRKKGALMFEVKTSSDTQSVYTAIGQLIIHTPVVASHFGNASLRRIIVLPQKPVDRLHRALQNQLGIDVLAYSRSKDGNVSFDDLTRLK